MIMEKANYNTLYSPLFKNWKTSSSNRLIGCYI
jgi:hypothetical protein